MLNKTKALKTVIIYNSKEKEEHFKTRLVYGGKLGIIILTYSVKKNDFLFIFLNI